MQKCAQSAAYPDPDPFGKMQILIWDLYTYIYIHFYGVRRKHMFVLASPDSDLKSIFKKSNTDPDPQHRLHLILFILHKNNIAATNA